MKKEVILRWVPDPYDETVVPAAQKSMQDIRLEERKIYVIGRRGLNADIVIPTTDETLTISRRNTAVYVKNGTAYVGNFSTHGPNGTFINDEKLATIAECQNGAPVMNPENDPGKNWIAVTGNDVITIGGSSRNMYFRLEGSELPVRVTYANYHDIAEQISGEDTRKYADSDLMKGDGKTYSAAKLRKILKGLGNQKTAVSLDESMIRPDPAVMNPAGKSYLGPLPVWYEGDPEDEEELEWIGSRDIGKYKADLKYQSEFYGDYTAEELLEWKELTEPGTPVSVPGFEKPPVSDDRCDKTVPAVKDYNCNFQYKNLGTIGKGGFATVYRIKDTRDGEELAMKVLDQSKRISQYVIDTTLREAQLGIAMNHENLVKYHAIRTTEPYRIFMEYCDGGSVKKLMENNGGRLDIEEATGYILQVLDGLDYMHNCTVTITDRNGKTEQREKLVHRDVKPDNMLIKVVNGKKVIKLTDFGLAKSTELSGLSGITTTQIAGSPNYVSKRQFSGYFKDSDYPEDVFSAAASYYEMLTGRPVRPFKDSRLQEDYILKGIRTPILEANSQIPAKLAAVIDSVLSEEDRMTADTFTTAAEFKEMIINASVSDRV